MNTRGQSPGFAGDPSTGEHGTVTDGHTIAAGRGGVHESEGLMSSTVQHLPVSQGSLISDTQLVGNSADGSRRGQGWIIVLGASAVLWTGIVVAIVGIAGLAQ